MTRVKWFKYGAIVIVIGFLANVIETGYYGWHFRASCPAEVIWDYISGAILFLGWIMLIWSAIKPDNVWRQARDELMTVLISMENRITNLERERQNGFQ